MDNLSILLGGGLNDLLTLTLEAFMRGERPGQPRQCGPSN